MLRTACHLFEMTDNSLCIFVRLSLAAQIAGQGFALSERVEDSTLDLNRMFIETPAVTS